ncbi:complement factor I [Poecilia formosa]|uniref:trypsin n=1 Tax=Poecilia formosa TaxID=48698 RepID=A0A087X9F3_POEFO|nr:PREDICTED: complement factor I [Poecilia formosa]
MRSDSFLLLFLLIVGSQASNPSDSEQPKAIEQQPEQSRQKPKFPKPKPTPVATTPAPKTTKAPDTDEFLGPQECLDKKLTRASCGLVFCPPWQRCVEGQCTCKLPYLCPTEGVKPVCGQNHRTFTSYCQAMASSCRTKKPVVSHFGNICTVNIPKYQSFLDKDTGLIRVFLPNATGGRENLLLCQQDWDMAAANVACREHKHPLGAASADSVDYNSLTPNTDLPSRCVSVHCQGYEMSLAECEIYDKMAADGGMVAAATCYKETPEECGFTCANQKCIFRNQTCDGVDDCGDRSDEMCCKSCRNGAFHCRSGVCLHRNAVGDQLIDCLDGADEAQKRVEAFTSAASDNVTSAPNTSEYISRKNETRANRKHLEAKLSCGIPNKDLVDDTETDNRGRKSRRKRVVGGIPANPTQIQWQVALEENRRIDCGGAYIGGCWVLTAAHCVRPNPSAFKVKFSLWKKFRAQGTTDIVPVTDIRIHPNYVASTYENDIALVQLEKLPFTDKCLEDNPAVRAVCVPWTTQLFPPNHTCSISGWGRTADGRSAQVLLWANVSLISGCESSYKHRFKPGMMCAGDLEGHVDSCQGDSGGPLVCQDELGVSYLWGIVSWGERCGHQGFPGVYTQVAHYFEWIRLHTGWPAVTKFNS